jgi:glycosyltransferase involved in cell wall biosynthesis
MDGLIVKGPFVGSSGYAHHTREFVKEFVRQGIKVQLVERQGWGGASPDEARDNWFRSLSEPVESGVVLHFAMPHQVEAVPHKRNVNYTMFEADRIPASWVARGMRHDLVIVPTESSRRAWVDSGIEESSVRICPLGIDASLFAQEFQPMSLQVPDGRLLEQYRCRFLNISELRQRKNHVGLLRAWARATSPQDDAVLILKMSAYQSHILGQFQQDLDEMQQRLGKSLREAAPVFFLMAVYTDKLMPKLYAAATHYLSMSFSEGWDLPMMEAAASGLHLIAPEHSAYTTYLDQTVAHMLPCEEVPAAFDGHLGREDAVFFKGAHWWRPDEDAAVALIRAIIDGTMPEKLSPRQRILDTFTWERATSRLIKLLEEITSG